jgi:hypothetical protein
MKNVDYVYYIILYYININININIITTIDINTISYHIILYYIMVGFLKMRDPQNHRFQD